MSGDSDDKDGAASGEKVTGGQGAAGTSTGTGHSPLSDVAAAFAQALIDTANDTDPERARQREEREAENEARLERLFKERHARLKQK